MIQVNVTDLNSKEPGSSPAVTEPSIGKIFTTIPIHNKPVGWNTRLKGTCPDAESNVVVRDSQMNLLDEIPCVGGAWEKFVDLSSLALGAQTIKLYQVDSNGSVLASGEVTVLKKTKKCDNLSSRAVGFAGGLSGGTGTMTDPYVVCTANQLKELSSGNYSYLIQNDIDFDDLDTNGDSSFDGNDIDFISGLGWASINVDGAWVKDNFLDGDDFEIRNLKQNRPAGLAGLFSSANFRTLKNMKLIGINIVGDEAGGLTRYCDNSVLKNVHVEGSITSGSGTNTGGLCGRGASIILSSSFTGFLSGWDSTGGLIGSGNNSFLVVVDSYVNADVVGNHAVGGIAGSFGSTYPGIISNSYSAGNVKGFREVGGLAGSYGTIYNSYSTSKISLANGTNALYGGLSGFGASIYNSFFAGNIEVTTGNAFSVLSPGIGESINNHYWSGGQCTGSGSCEYQGTPHANIADFKNLSNAPLNQWDFLGSTDGTEDHWSLDNGLPEPWWTSDTAWINPFVGDGTDLVPYKISSVTDLKNIGSNSRLMGSTFELMADLDLTSASATFKRIGGQSVFYGNFKGNSHQITNYTFNDPTDNNNLGLFSSLSFVYIEKLRLLNFNITGNFRVGALAGTVHRSTITEVSSGGTVSGGQNVAGLMGYTYSSNISKISSTATVIGTGNSVGGLIGDAGAWTNITDSYYSGSLTGTHYVGGIIGGMTYGGTLSRCYVSGSITGLSLVGGIAGQRYEAITQSFSVASVTGNSNTDNVGLLVGDSGNIAASINNYSATGVSCNNSGGGGCNTDIYADKASSTLLYDPTESPLTFWDFSNIWNSRQGTSQFPALR